LDKKKDTGRSEFKLEESGRKRGQIVDIEKTKGGKNEGVGKQNFLRGAFSKFLFERGTVLLRAQEAKSPSRKCRVRTT